MQIYLAFFIRNEGNRFDPFKVKSDVGLALRLDIPRE
jgi:hypothetical protein